MKNDIHRSLRKQLIVHREYNQSYARYAAARFAMEVSNQSSLLLHQQYPFPKPSLEKATYLLMVTPHFPPLRHHNPPRRPRPRSHRDHHHHHCHTTIIMKVSDLIGLLLIGIEWIQRVEWIRFDEWIGSDEWMRNTVIVFSLNDS